MIRPDGFRGAAFGTGVEGDLRNDRSERRRIAEQLGIPDDWAYPSQVHGATVKLVHESGPQGEADALYVDLPGVPIAVATADCVPVIIEADEAVAVVHAGWRGTVAGVVPETLAALEWSGHTPRRAAIGPAIGPCCYEVGAEVARRFGDHVATTTWGTTSVDIPGYLTEQLGGLDVWRSDLCTYTSDALHSHRRDGTRQRQVAVAWVP